MKEQFHIVLITVSLFVAGLLMGVWTQKTRPIPPPPAPVLGEFGNLSSPEIREGGYAPGMGGFAIERFSPGHPAAIVTMTGTSPSWNRRSESFRERSIRSRKSFERNSTSY
jgi:hypothetical protein